MANGPGVLALMTNSPSWHQERPTVARDDAHPSTVGLSWRHWTRVLSDSQDLLLLGLELLVADDALIPKLGEPFQLTHVLGLGRGRGGGCRCLGRLLLAAEVFSHSQPALDERAAPLHARHGPVGLPCLHTACGPVRHESHLCSPSSPVVRLA